MSAQPKAGEGVTKDDELIQLLRKQREEALERRAVLASYILSWGIAIVLAAVLWLFAGQTWWVAILVGLAAGFPVFVVAAVLLPRRAQRQVAWEEEQWDKGI